jgi:hypothetical protein
MTGETTKPDPGTPSPDQVAAAQAALTQAATEPSPAPPPTAPAPTSQDASAGTVASATAAAQNLALQNAPWSRTASWPVILVQAVVLGIVGVVLILAPESASHTVLEILGLLLFARACFVIYRIFRGQVAPDRVALTAFEAGVNATVGLLVVIGALLVPASAQATTALAVILGVGFLLFGAVSILGALLRRQPGQDLPIARLLLAGAAVLVGILLVLNGSRGFDSVRGTFVLLGWILLFVGIALGAYSWFIVRARGGTEET